jgi:hypothetical protein
MKHKAITCLSAFVLIAATTSARADAIDGQWCFSTSHLEIQGPTITTPGGNKIDGNYSRHGFRYIVPANEPDPGSEITMVLYGEELMELTRKGAPAPEKWRRCKPIS